MFLEQKSRLIIKYSKPIIALAIVLSVIGGYFTTKLPLQSNLADLLPDSFASVKALKLINEEVGGVGSLRIVLESSDSEGLKRFANNLAPKLLADDLIKYVDYKNDVAFYKKNALLLVESSELDTLEQRIQGEINKAKQKLNPLFVDDLFGDDEDESADTDTTTDLKAWRDKYSKKIPSEYYTNEDSTVLVISVSPSEGNSSLSFIEKLLGEVQEIVDAANPRQYAPDMEIYYGGNYKNRLDEYEVVRRDIFGTAYMGLGGVFLLIVIYFRRFSGALLISFTLLCSLAWTFGVTYLVIGNLNTITGFLFVILFGLGIDYGIHGFARYVECRRAGMSFEESLDLMVSQTGRALATTAVTTSAAFYSLTLMKFKGFSDLGFISGTGILFALVAMVVLLPAIITVLEQHNWLKFKRGAAPQSGLMPKRIHFSRVILGFAAVLTLFSIYSATNIAFEYDFTNLRAITDERKTVGEKTHGVFDVSESPAVVLTRSREELTEVVNAVNRIIAEDTQSPTVDMVRSIYSLVPPNQQEKLKKIKDIRDLVENEALDVAKGNDKEILEEFLGYLEVEKPFTWEDFPEKDKRQFITKNGEIGNFVFIYPSVALRNGKNAIDFRDDVGVIKTESGKIFHASSSNIILADMLTILISEGEWAVGLTFLVVFLIVLIDFRSLKSALLVLMPLVLGVLWMTTFMYLFGMKWNLFNLVVIPSIIGIGVDNGVHIYHRYLEEGPGSLSHVLKNTGAAIFMTTSTTIVGYSGLILAHHPGLNSIGELALVGLVLTFITAVVVLPATLQFMEERNSQKHTTPELKTVES